MSSVASNPKNGRACASSAESVKSSFIGKKAQTYPEACAQSYLRAMQRVKSADDVRKLQQGYENAKTNNDRFTRASSQSLKACRHLEREMTRVESFRGMQANLSDVESFALRYLEKNGRKKDPGNFRIKARDLKFQ